MELFFLNHSFMYAMQGLPTISSLFVTLIFWQEDLVCLFHSLVPLYVRVNNLILVEVCYIVENLNIKQF